LEGGKQAGFKEVRKTSQNSSKLSEKVFNTGKKCELGCPLLPKKLVKLDKIVPEDK
jgi:hypothetical protein